MWRMKSPLSLTLIVCLVASALPLTAQEQTVTPGSFDLGGPASPATAGPLARAVTREAVRLAATVEPTTSGIETVQQGGKAADSNWSRVRKLAPGTEIIVTVKSSPPGPRYFVAGDESDLTVLNLTDPTLPHAAKDVLRDVASNHPDYFPAAQQHGTFLLEKNVRMGPDGVFVADRKVADLGQVVENIARNDVAEIKTPPKSNCDWCNDWRPTVGALAGLFAGALIGGGVADCKTDNCVARGLVYGGVAGFVIGSVLGYLSYREACPNAACHYAASHKPDDVIYSAP